MSRTLRPLALAALFLCLSTLNAAAADAPQRPGLPDGADTSGRKTIVFVTGKPSHGFAQHEQYAGCMLLARALNENVPGVVAEVYKHEWPKDEHAFDKASAVVIFCDGGPGHMAIPHLTQLSELMDRGVGLGCIHYAVELPKGEPGTDFQKWIGGYFETFFSVNPTWTADYKRLPEHEVTRGVRPFSTKDEWYYHMRFRDGMEGVTPILSAVPPDSTRQGRDDAHGGNPSVRAGIGKNIPETTIWVATRDHEGRGFGCTGAHYHFNWAQDDFRKTVLNAVLWIAHVDVPKEGVVSKRPTIDDLLANLDPKKVPDNFNKDNEQKALDAMNQPLVSSAK